MILIADSGSSKTDWAVIDDQQNVSGLETPGINPYLQNAGEIENSVAGFFAEELRPRVTAIHFYGAGCIKNATDKIIIRAFSEIFPDSEIEAEDDLLGAARALFGKNEGIACILGTGSNSCLYNGTSIVDKVPALGFILGDEGSGSNLGKTFLNSYFKRLMPDDLAKQVAEELKPDMRETLHAVYREPFPNRYLAGFSKFILKNIDHPFLKEMVYNSIEAFFSKNIERYPEYKNMTVGFTGSVAYYYAAVIREIALKRGLLTGEIQQKPIDGLIRFHTTNTNRK